MDTEDAIKFGSDPLLDHEDPKIENVICNGRSSLLGWNVRESHSYLFLCQGVITVLPNAVLDFEQIHRTEFSVEAYDSPNDPTKQQLAHARVSTRYSYCL